MTIIIQKFGGTSLRDANGLSSLLSHVKKVREQGKDLVIVVSSMGRKGEPYATDTLINQLEKIGSNIDPMKKDLIMSCGEIISSALVAHLLDTNNMPAVPLTGFQAGIITDKNFNSSEILDIDIENILKHLKKGNIVVVAGFQGVTLDMEITTLGRGGSDITAVVLGGFLDAQRVDIFTDVDGVAVIDPRIIPSARYLETISYSNMYNLASNGAKVVHPKAILAAEKYNIPIHIRNTFSHEKGTIISKNEKVKQNNIIGIGLNKDIESKKGWNKILIFFAKVNNKEVKKNIKNFISYNRDQISNILWGEGVVEFRIDPNQAISFTENLYNYFFQLKKLK